MRNNPDRRQRPESPHYRRRRQRRPRNGHRAENRTPWNSESSGEDRGRTTCSPTHEPLVWLDRGTLGHHHLRRLLLCVLAIPRHALPRLAFTIPIGLSRLRGLGCTGSSGAISGSVALATIELAASWTSRREYASTNSHLPGAGAGEKGLVPSALRPSTMVCAMGDRDTIARDGWQPETGHVTC